MKTILTLSTSLTITICAHSNLLGQEYPAATSEEHQWLKKFVGQWDVASEGPGADGQPNITGKAVMTSSMLGDLWLVNTSDMEVAGMKMKAVQMIGYDTEKKKYVGVWADSMVNHMWQLEGTVNEAGTTLTLEGEGPNATGDGMTLFRDTLEFIDDETIIATSTMKGADGQWTLIMKGTAKRRKSASR